MKDLSNIQWDREWAKLVEEIQTKVTPFDHDSIEKKIARKKRAAADKFFFAATYFPHYIDLPEAFKTLWRDPSAKIDWIAAGFSELHSDFWKITELDNRFHICAAHRESAKDTLLGKIDVLHKVYHETNWFTAIIALTDVHAVTKVLPLKLEIENNKRLQNDYGDLVGKIKWEQGEFLTSNGRKIQSYSIDQSLRGQENFTHRVDYFQLNDIEDPTKSFNRSLCMQAVQSIRQDKMESVNQPRWSGLYLCNYVSQESVTHELLNGLHTEHFDKHIWPVLILNSKQTAAQKKIAAECSAAGYTDIYRSVWESRHPTLKMLKKWKDDPDTFEPEWMMRPRDKKEKIFKRKDPKFYTPEEIAGKPMAAWTFIDPSAKEARDYKAIITLGISKNSELFEGYCLRASIRQESVDWLLDTTYEHFKAFNSLVIGVEMISFAVLLEREYLREMKKRGPLPLVKIEHVENKNAKIAALVPIIRSGLIRFNPQDTEQSLLLDQFFGFPDPIPVHRGGVGDDGPDAFAECYKLMQSYPYGQDFEFESGDPRPAQFNEGSY